MKYMQLGAKACGKGKEKDTRAACACGGSHIQHHAVPGMRHAYHKCNTHVLNLRPLLPFE
jgi:hypothetical protein